jgi:undecaprenyl-diphosphatase
MLKAVIFWSLSLVVLLGGALAVCPDGHCIVPGFDPSGLGLADALRSAWLDRLMPVVAWFGSLMLLLPLTGWVAWRLFRDGRRRAAGFVTLALLGSSALGHLVKLGVARPRPDLFAWVAMPESWSYPSSHAMQVTAVALALILVAGRRLWLAPLLFVVLLVGASRVYLQVHFPSDVIAGTLAAAFWVGGLHALIARRGGRV